jgi:hypothetical protein
MFGNQTPHAGVTHLNGYRPTVHRFDPNLRQNFPKFDNYPLFLAPEFVEYVQCRLYLLCISKRNDTRSNNNNNNDNNKK